ncbi:MAG TPA: carboxypeptidase regulatory-like domain-containing protein [Candidatus Cloacimonadota bacterium]|nr:carboxypeptidase regulatory-like domain-containing protein [Candidatus Cloacimonadota bacterium]
MKVYLLIFLVVASTFLWSVEYTIQLSWDDFEGECNGFMSGSIGKEHGFVSGGGEEQALSGKLVSLGEGMSMDVQQVFKINSDEGLFTFWIKDKFADDDLNNDPTLIAKAKPMISVYNGNNLIDLIKVPAGSGLACKVFTLDAESGEIDREIRYFPKARIIVGRVLNAVDGNPITGANVMATDYLRESDMVITDENGFFMFEAEIGEYKVAASQNGFIGTAATIRMGADETPREIIFALSPEIKEFRIVLTWGSRPRDLDAHLSGPDPDGGNFHIWYRNKYPIGGRDFLDRDDTDKYGPETITIYKPAVGEYYYSVYDYTDRAKKSSKHLSRSNATVNVYGQNKLLATFEIEPDQKGNCWHVFKIDETHEIIPINQVDFVKDEREIR